MESTTTSADGVSLPKVVGLEAATFSGIPSLTADIERSRWLWSHLRRAFPNVLAAAVTPDRIHVVAQYISAADASHRLNRLVGQLARRFQLGHQVGRVAHAHDVVGDIAQTVRTVLLVPVAAGLASDPLEWPWSTHRDAVGATVVPWITLDSLRPRLAFEDVRQFHRFVTAKLPDGPTPFPTPEPPTALPSVSLADIAHAAASATRNQLDAIKKPGPTRQLFVLLAVDQGWTNLDQLADICRYSRRTALRASQRRDDKALAAGRLCLSDGRLR